MEKNYIMILKECLEKKVKILEEVFQQNTLQKEVLQGQKLDDKALEDTIHRKDELLEQLIFLDNGFEELYERVGHLLSDHKEVYQSEIVAMQELIRKITDLNLSIRAQEQENKRMITARFQKERREARQVRTSNAAATKYYQNMSRLNNIEPQFMDKKK